MEKVSEETVEEICKRYRELYPKHLWGAHYESAMGVLVAYIDSLKSQLAEERAKVEELEKKAFEAGIFLQSGGITYSPLWLKGWFEDYKRKEGEG